MFNLSLSKVTANALLQEFIWKCC